MGKGWSAVIQNLKSVQLTRPAVVRRRLMALQKCTAGVASSKGRQNLEACDSRSRKNSTSHLFWLVQTFSNLSHLFTPVHACSHLFIPQWLSTLFAQWQFLVEFPPCKSCFFFFDLACYLVEIAYFCSPNQELSRPAVFCRRLMDFQSVQRV